MPPLLFGSSLLTFPFLARLRFCLVLSSFFLLLTRFDWSCPPPITLFFRPRGGIPQQRPWKSATRHLSGSIFVEHTPLSSHFFSFYLRFLLSNRSRLVSLPANRAILPRGRRAPPTTSQQSATRPFAPVGSTTRLSRPSRWTSSWGRTSRLLGGTGTSF
jgi:hypothetical protein